MPGETILIVEDEGIIAVHLRRVLTAFGYQVPDPVESGPKAVSQAMAVHPDLVLMDIQLVGAMDGIEAAGIIREQMDIPIIYLTAFAEDSRLLQARKTQPYGYLVKPVQERELRATIEMALYKHRLDLKLKESEAAYRTLYHNTPAMLQTIDLDGTIVQVSDYWLQVLGYTREEVVGHPVFDFVEDESRKAIREILLPELIRNGFVHDSECRFVTRRGQAIDLYFSILGVYDAQGIITHALLAMVDISARKRAEAAERDQRALAEALRETASALSSTLSLDEVFKLVLEKVGQVVPYQGVNIMLVRSGKAYIERANGFNQAGVVEPDPEKEIAIEATIHLRLMAETKQPIAFPDTRKVSGWGMEGVRSYAGSPIIAHEQVLGFINLTSATPGFFNNDHAIRLRAFADQAAVAIENARLYAEVQRLATLDELTGVYNRRRLFEMGQREFERARRYGSSLAAVLLDIDLFKDINDTHGHTTGDEVLARLAATIQQSVREVDVFGRYGGEEFVILLPEATMSSAQEVAERLRSLVEELRFESNRGSLTVTISLGIAMLTDNIPSLAMLIDHADQAMYAAKQAGRNRVGVYEHSFSYK